MRSIEMTRTVNSLLITLNDKPYKLPEPVDI